MTASYHHGETRAITFTLAKVTGRTKTQRLKALESVVMSSVKEALYHSIERLSDEEAHQTLAFIQQLREQRDIASILKRLAHHPAFRLPAETQGGFRMVEPLKGKGIPASRRLVEERR